MDARRSTRSVKNPSSTSSPPLVEKTPPAATPVAQVQKRRKMNTDGAEESQKKNDGEDNSEKNINVGVDKSEGKKKKKKKKQVKEGEKKIRRDNGEGESNGVLNQKSKSKNKKKKKPKSTTTNASENKAGRVMAPRIKLSPSPFLDNPPSASSSSEEEAEEEDNPFIQNLFMALSPSPFLDNPPSASSSSEEEEAEEEEIGEAQNGSDSDDDFFEFSKKPNPKLNVKASAKPKVWALWSEEDEIVVLEGVRVWKNKAEAFNKVSGLIFIEAVGGLLNEIKGSLHFSPVENQLYTKIRGLRDKYFDAMKNKNEEDEDPVFSSPHSHECRRYLIMKDIWAYLYVDVYARSKEKVVNAGADSDTVEEVGDDNEDRKDKWELLDNLSVNGISKCVLQEGLRLIGDKKVKLFQKEWKEFHKVEAVVYSERMKLLQETTEAVLEAAKSSKV